jgi:hypothetical protein
MKIVMPGGTGQVGAILDRGNLPRCLPAWMLWSCPWSPSPRRRGGSFDELAAFKAGSGADPDQPRPYRASARQK